MLDIECQSIEPMARTLDGGNGEVRKQFISASLWDDAAILRVHQKEVTATTGKDDGVLILDGCNFPKQGQNSVGVARQHYRAEGKT